MERFICIHGHFYQPPRENPWLEAVELQDSAYPYHDWNERICAECYAPNTAARILDADHSIIDIVNNFERMSFNVGPTLINWLRDKAPHVYEAIVTADRRSRARYSGHGSALMQPYNHMILPLANRRDKRTQILWGIHHFRDSFEREPEGMWLAETAVDLETLEIAAEAGIRYTVLSPYQARRVKATRGRIWHDVSEGRIDPSTAYTLRLRSGRQISLFFYDAPISKAIAFENLLERGENLADRLMGAFVDDRAIPQLVHIATDGETYGHHRRHGDMALAFAMNHIEASGVARLTNYGEFLEAHPPAHDVEIFENSSWSCIHGIERWRSNCGCCSGGRPDWNQEWRAPLRSALDWLRDNALRRWEPEARRIFVDPWRARDEYIQVILDRSPDSIEGFLRKHLKDASSGTNHTPALELLELQRHAMLMYTSCGWFFDELSGIETLQVLQYAGRVVQLAKDLFTEPLEEGFLALLEAAHSNIPAQGNGRQIYEKHVRPGVVNIEQVGAHYAVSSLFEEYPETARVYCYQTQQRNFALLTAGRARLALGKAVVTSDVTQESAELTFGVLHLGDQTVCGGIRRYRGEPAYLKMKDEITQLFQRGDLPELVRSVDRNFGSGAYTLRLLFRDEQRRILSRILDHALSEAAMLYKSFFAQYATLGRFITEMGAPLPPRFQMAVDFTIHDQLSTALSAAEPDSKAIREALDEVRFAGIILDSTTLEFQFRKNVDSASRHWRESPRDSERLTRLLSIVSICPQLPFEINLWSVQNDAFEVLSKHSEKCRTAAALGDESASFWIDQTNELCGRLNLRVNWAAKEYRQ